MPAAAIAGYSSWLRRASVSRPAGKLLAGAAGLVGAAALGLPSAGRRQAAGDPGAGLEDMLYQSTTSAEPVPLAAIRTAVAGIRADFQNARYDRLSTSLPALRRSTVATARRASANVSGSSPAWAACNARSAVVHASGSSLSLTMKLAAVM